jgi:hypothetical protein
MPEKRGGSNAGQVKVFTVYCAYQYGESACNLKI